MAKKVIDVGGSDIVSTALIDLLNAFPGLNGKTVCFSELEDKSGIGFFPTGGAAVNKKSESITGHISMECSYPFDLVYRVAAKTQAQRITAKELLDSIGKWLEREPVTIGGRVYRLSEYPILDSRIIRSISRASPAHMDAAYQDGVEDWIISASLNYTYEYDT